MVVSALNACTRSGCVLAQSLDMLITPVALMKEIILTLQRAVTVGGLINRFVSQFQSRHPPTPHPIPYSQSRSDPGPG